LKIFKPVDGDSRRSRRELKKARLLLGIPTSDALEGGISISHGPFRKMGLTYRPEVLNHLVRLRVSSVVGMLLPVVDIDICDAADKQLELALVKDIDKLGRDELVEAAEEGGELLLHPLLDSPFDEQAGKVSTGD
jgi:hypothetical protein